MCTAPPHVALEAEDATLPPIMLALCAEGDHIQRLVQTWPVGRTVPHNLLAKVRIIRQPSPPAPTRLPNDESLVGQQLPNPVRKLAGHNRHINAETLYPAEEIWNLSPAPRSYVDGADWVDTARCCASRLSLRSSAMSTNSPRRIQATNLDGTGCRPSLRIKGFSATGFAAAHPIRHHHCCHQHHYSPCLL